MARRNLRTYLPLFVVPLLLAACQNDGLEAVRDISLSAAALNDYQGPYARDPQHKAFAISPDGAFAAGHSFPNGQLASAAALLDCNERVQPGQLECLIYDVNGQIVASTPLRLGRK